MKAGFSRYALIGLTVFMVACSTAPRKEDQGALIGMIVGGIIGHQVGDGSGQAIATMVGTAAGAMIGGSVGRSMDKTDRMYAGAALENVRTGVPSTWVNPDTGYEYTVTPTQTYESAQGPCREYTLDALIGGNVQQVYGTACRQPDGSWSIVN